MNGKVRIDAFPESAFRYLERHTIVCIDVISSSTTVLTAVAQGRRVFPAGDVAEAGRLAHLTAGALLAGEPLPGDGSLRFDLTKSPAALSHRSDGRPLVLLDLPGTRLIANCHGGREVFVACLRNLSATVEFLASRRDEVVLLGAGEDGDFRCEDKMAAARIGRGLVARGFTPEGQGTADIIERWGEAAVSLLGWGRSADRLRSLGRQDDLEFVLNNVDDLDVVCRYQHGEVSAAAGPETPGAPARRSEALV